MLRRWSTSAGASLAACTLRPTPPPAAAHYTHQHRTLISLWRKKKKEPAPPHKMPTPEATERELLTDADKALLQAAEERQRSEGHLPSYAVKGPKLVRRQTAVPLSERFGSRNWTPSSSSDAATADAGTGAQQAPGGGATAMTAAGDAAPSSPQRGMDVDETGRGKVLPTEFVLCRKRSALRITWKVPRRRSYTNTAATDLPHEEAAIVGDDATGSTVHAPAARRFDELVTVTETITVQAELLRVEAPSTDVKGAGVTLYGKRGITIKEVLVIGNYAVRIIFSDGHDAGIFSYGYLYELCSNKWPLMRDYVTRLREMRKRRDPPVKVGERAGRVIDQAMAEHGGSSGGAGCKGH